MSARDDILAAIRTAAVPAAVPAAIPADAANAPPSGAELRQAFLGVLTEVGGRGAVRRADQTVEQALTDFLGAERTGVLVARGRFAVAENAAVYVDAADLAARSDIVLAEHLVLVVPAEAIVPTMHEAVRMMPADSACGWFLSGPSKTADIEQALVFGAQGARTLLVILS